MRSQRQRGCMRAGMTMVAVCLGGRCMRRWGPAAAGSREKGTTSCSAALP